MNEPADRFGDEAVPRRLLAERAFNLRWAEVPDGVIPLTAADPDFAAPPAVREALEGYARSGVYPYGPPAGLPEFRTAVAQHFRTRRNAPVSPDGVIATNSAAAGLAMVARHWLRAGDEVIVFDPVDFLLDHVATAAGATPVRWSVGRFEPLDLERLAALVTPRTRAIFVCSPHNPLGRCFTADELSELAHFAADRDLWVLADEVWSDICYPPARFHSMLALDPELSRRVMVVGGFSKGFALAGLRIGYVACTDPALAAALLESSEHPSTVDGASTIGQIAAAAAYDHAQDWLAEFVDHLRHRRDQCVDALSSMPGVSVEAPDATFVAFPRIGSDTIDTERLAERLVTEFGVAVVPGTPRWFGAGAAGHLRISFATSEVILAEGLRRLAAGLERCVDRS